MSIRGVAVAGEDDDSDEEEQNSQQPPQPQAPAVIPVATPLPTSPKSPKLPETPVAALPVTIPMGPQREAPLLADLRGRSSRVVKSRNHVVNEKLDRFDADLAQVDHMLSLTSRTIQEATQSSRTINHTLDELGKLMTLAPVSLVWSK